MRILAIDPSLSCTGVVCAGIGEVGLRIYWGQEINTSAKDGRADRVFGLFQGIRDAIERGKPSVVLIEDYAFSRAGQVNSITPLAEAVGAIICAAREKGVSVVRVPSSTWRSILKWKAMKKATVAEKAAYIDTVASRFKFIAASPDLADAMMIALAARRAAFTKGKLAPGARKLREAILGPVEEKGNGSQGKNEKSPARSRASR